MTNPLLVHVLFVEDNPSDALVVQDELAHAKRTSFSVVHQESLKQALAQLKSRRFDVVLLDLSLPDAHGFETFLRLHEAAPELPVVVFSGRDDEELAVRAVQAGAQDYLVKGRLGDDVLERSLRYAVERRKAERKLAESEERYRSLIEQSPDGYVVHCDEKIVFANAACLRLFGAAGLPQLLGRPFLEFISPDHHAKIGARNKQAGGDRSYRALEIESIGLDGDRLMLEETSHPFLHEGRPAVQVVLRNITERKRSEERFRWLVDSNAQGVMFWNTNGAITGGNDAFLEMVGLTHADLEAGHVNWRTLTAPEHADLDNGALEEVRVKGYCTPYEKDFVRQDGTRVPVLIGASVFRDNPEEGVCFTLNLTERNRLQQHSLRTQRMESIGTLAGGIAHDLNNSLGPIITALELLKLKFPDQDSQELLSIVGSSAQRGADMVRQVLSFARGMEGRRMDVQIKHLVREIEKIAGDTFPKNILVRSILPHGLWTVLGDPTQLHQVLLNLFLNARDAMPQGGTLTVSAENFLVDAQYTRETGNPEAKPGPYISIQVSDTGTGIPAEVVEKIFDPFFTTKELGKGTGLGLSTALAILKSHRGYIRVYSEMGKGTKFCVYLPAQPESSAEVGPELESSIPRGNGELILVVDDESALRQITRQTLETFGYRVVVACDGAEAVAVYARQGEEIAAVITDMMMPIMDGPTTIKVLRRMDPLVRIIAASGLDANGPEAVAASLGVSHLLPKPYTTESLLKHLTLLLSAKPGSGGREASVG